MFYKPIAAIEFSYTRMSNRIPILTYHSIDDSGSVISISPQKFRLQMHYLREKNFNIVSLKDIVQYLREKVTLPPRSVSITFDDGFANLHSVAYPILKSCGFTATIFLVPGHCGKNNQWQGQPGVIPILDLLDWDRIKEMADDGFDFGAHTMRHADLSTLTTEQAREEIVNSKLTIEERLGRPVQFFAYPYGSATSEIRDIVTDEFSGACSVKLNFSSLKSDIHMLPRIDMYYFSNNNLFESIGTRVFSSYIFCRSIIRSIRNQVGLRTDFSTIAKKNDK